MDESKRPGPPRRQDLLDPEEELDLISEVDDFFAMWTDFIEESDLPHPRLGGTPPTSN